MLCITLGIKNRTWKNVKTKFTFFVCKTVVIICKMHLHFVRLIVNKQRIFDFNEFSRIGRWPFIVSNGLIVKCILVNIRKQVISILKAYEIFPPCVQLVRNFLLPGIIWHLMGWAFSSLLEPLSSFPCANKAESNRIQFADVTNNCNIFNDGTEDAAGRGSRLPLYVRGFLIKSIWTFWVCRSHIGYLPSSLILPLPA